MMMKQIRHTKTGNGELLYGTEGLLVNTINFSY